MTPDDAPIPGFDAVARAARAGLGRLASSGALGELSWDAVQSGAGRVRRRRITVLGAACLVVLLSAGIAVAATGSNDGNLRVNGNGTPTTADETTTTTTAVDRPTTTTTADSTPGVVDTTTTIPWAYAEPSDFDGTLTLASTTLVAEQPVAVSLTVRNVVDHTILVGGLRRLDVWMDPNGSYSRPGVDDNRPFVLAPNETRTFTSEIAPRPEMVGNATVRAALVDDDMHYHYGCVACRADYIAGVPSVDVTVVPPGWVEGQPLDPSQGSWSATMSADAAEVRVGDTVRVHATLHNRSDQLQRTVGYASLSIVCTNDSEPYWRWGKFIDSAIVPPGATQDLAVDFSPPGNPGTIASCWLGVVFDGNPGHNVNRDTIETDFVRISVVPAAESTTTTVPETTTTMP